MKKKLALTVCGAAVASILAGITPVTQAGGITDGTVGAVQNFSGNFTIPQTLGRISGGNLFHSFQNFSVNIGESATFTTTSPLSNVISRVTGGTASNINGLLKLSPASGSAPNFFFINPAGVIFGTGAVVDVPAGFHVSTANYLKFSDGAFHADPNRTSTFSAAVPEAFGFLGETRTSIVVKDGAQIATQALQQLSLVAGDIEINNAQVSTQGGNVLTVALGARSEEVGLTDTSVEGAGRFDIVNGGSISAPSIAGVDGGRVVVSGGDITIDAQEGGTTGVFANASAGTGNAGSIIATASGNLRVQKGARISSSTTGAGNAGLVRVSAANITIDGYANTSGIFSRSEQGAGTGNAGNVEVNAAGNITLFNGGAISSTTFTSGNAGTVKVSAGNLSIDGGDDTAGIFSLSAPNSNGSRASGNAGSLEVHVAGNLAIGYNAWITSSTSTLGRAGTVKVSAGNLSIDGNAHRFGSGIVSESRVDNSSIIDGGDAGTVDVSVAGNLVIANGGTISTMTDTTGNGGTVKVRANNIVIDGRSLFNGTGILAEAYGTTGRSGDVEVYANGNLSIVSRGSIASSTYSNGNAGLVTVGAQNIRLEESGGILSEACNFRCSGQIIGNAGIIDVTASGEIGITTGGKISSSSWTAGNAGTISVSANSINIDGQGESSEISSYNVGSGLGGTISVQAANGISLVNGGQISASTTFQGNGGAIQVNAGSLTIDAQGMENETGVFSYAGTQSSADAGSIDLTIQGKLSIRDGGRISTSTDSYRASSAGTVRVSAENIEIDGRNANGQQTGILSEAHTNNRSTFGSTGNAGNVEVIAANSLSVTNGAQISSNTFYAGEAGAVTVRAANIDIGSGASVSSLAGIDSTGKNGSVDITATNRLSLANGGKLSIQNLSTLNEPGMAIPEATTLRVSAPFLNLQNGEITASATGVFNASNIFLASTNRLYASTSSISTSAESGNGGKVVIGGGASVSLYRSRITTSVNAENGGNGGNIDITAPVLVLNAGFVQANTAGEASSSRGGDVNINVESIVSSGNRLVVGGDKVEFQPQRFDLNVIQAASQFGVNGDIRISSPVIDLSGSLVGLNTKIIDFGNLEPDFCRFGDRSSLTQTGRGGPPFAAAGWLRP